MSQKEKQAAQQASEQGQQLPFDAVPAPEPAETAVEVLNQDGVPTGLLATPTPTPNLADILAHLEEVEDALEAGEAEVVNLQEKYWEAVMPGERKVAVFTGFKTITKPEGGKFKNIECARFVSKDGAFLLGGVQPVEDCKSLDINATVIIKYEGTKKTSSGMNAKIFTFALVAGRKNS